MRIQTIAALTDFSTAAEHAIDRAAMLAAKHQAELLLVYGAAQSNPALPHPQQRLEQSAQWLAHRHGIRVTALEYEGNSAERALAAAARADLLVIDHRCDHDMLRPWQGSTLGMCLRRSPCPVLVVQKPAQEAYARLLISADTSPASRRLVRFAGDLQHSASVDLFPAWGCTAKTHHPLYGYREELMREGKNRRLRMPDLFHARRNRVDAKLGASDDVTRRIMVQQQRSTADLIALAKPSAGWFPRWSMSRMAQRLLAQVNCDVLVCSHASEETVGEIAQRPLSARQISA